MRFWRLRAIGVFLLLGFAVRLPAFGSAAYPAPVVIVYPLVFTSGSPGTDAGANVSLIISSRLSAAGGLVIHPYAIGTERAHYLDAANAAHADYYIAGFLQPIGSDISMIVQVVSTYSGSIIFSSTSTIRTYGDAGGQADAMRDAILRHAGRGFAAVDIPQPVPSASAEPTAAHGVDLSRALGKRTPRSSPTSLATQTAAARVPSAVTTPGATAVSRAVATAAAPSTAKPMDPFAAKPAASPTAKPPAPVLAAGAGYPFTQMTAAPATVIVLDSLGAQSARTSAALLAAFARTPFRALRLTISSEEARRKATSLCRETPGITAFYIGTIELAARGGASTVADLSVDGFDCNGTTTVHETVTAGATPNESIGATIDRLATTFVTGLLAR